MRRQDPGQRARGVTAGVLVEPAVYLGAAGVTGERMGCCEAGREARTVSGHIEPPLHLVLAELSPTGAEECSSPVRQTPPLPLVGGDGGGGGECGTAV